MILPTDRVATPQELALMSACELENGAQVMQLRAGYLQDVLVPELEKKLEEATTKEAKNLAHNTLKQCKTQIANNLKDAEDDLKYARYMRERAGKQ